VLALLALPARAADEVDVYGLEDGGRPEQFVPPDYPKDALTRGTTGYVDVDAFVDGRLVLRDVRFHAGSQDAEVFVSGLRDVAKYWLFQPPVAKATCLPATGEKITFRVIYEIEAGAPHISIEVPKPQARTVKSLHPRCPVPHYPHEALREGVLANVFARVDIRPDGTVSQVQAQAYPETEGAAGTARFTEEVERTLRDCRFDPAEGEGRRAACYGVLFRTGR
jgi:hypothetical protein